MSTRKLFMAFTLSVGLGGAALPVLAAHTDIPAPPGPWTPGDYPSSGPGGTEYIGITGLAGQKGNTREYKVHVPKSYRAGVPMPILFCLPGVLETTTMFCVDGSNTSGPGPNGDTGDFITQSENNGFILVQAQGHNDSWNAGLCCSGARLDDVGFIRAVLAEVETHLNVDTKRVYAAGFSNGGFMSERLACDASDVFSAIVDGSGGIVTSCKPQKHVAVLEFHGNKDRIVPYALFKSTSKEWVKLNGCNSTTTPASFPNSGGDTTCETYTGCPADGTITGCTIDGGGHCWYGSPSCGTGFGPLAAKIALLGSSNSNFTVESDDMWPFLSKYHR